MHLATFIAQLPDWSVIDTYPTTPLELGHFHDWLALRPPKRVSSVIVLRPSAEARTRQSDRAPLFVAIGRFQSDYSMIAEVARSIAPAILLTGNIPLIRPVRESEVQAMPDDSLFAQRLRARGVRLWEAGSAA